ncbi:hypothetical protein HBI38_047800 [Parastagonospora nodorum]|nr:hypothetical protein HBH71_057080 [Parastagonospora nodorum]KAH5126783.1 hypothetical protein HBI73_095640 [Parastagonospora nodorum]KAH5312665.1 hypothetical protein HBI11_087630 [Parastagonospora nodorum]KAH5771746.1 hypothetical protein HBI17_016970 [Parastagonospora nodorum]KAH6026857.1 hypothetical protein HBI83_054550 [Parastagonospora nodorum]
MANPAYPKSTLSYPKTTPPPPIISARHTSQTIGLHAKSAICHGIPGTVTPTQATHQTIRSHDKSTTCRANLPGSPCQLCEQASPCSHRGLRRGGMYIASAGRMRDLDCVDVKSRDLA